MPPSVTLFGPVDTVIGPNIEAVILGLLIVNMAARAREYAQHRRQARDGGADALSRRPVRVGTNALLVVASFYYLTLHAHGGMVMSILVLGLVVTDVFEFESRKVEARREVEIERPRASIAASLLALLYAAFQSLFFLVAPYWNAVI